MGTCSLCYVLCALWFVLGTWRLVLGAWYLALGTLCGSAALRAESLRLSESLFDKTLRLCLGGGAAEIV